MSYDGVIGAVLPFLIFLANLTGGLVIGVALVRGLLVYLVALIRQRGGEIPQEAIRLSLGRSLALEFQLAADILGTALNPTREDLIILAVIAALRTALNYFLGRELDDVQRRERAMGEQGATGSLTPLGANPADAPLGKGAR